MSWSWQYERADGEVVGASGAFPTQSDAESWLGTQWRELLDSGIDQVSLLEDDRVAYGPMSLHPAG
jgi:hypothetical protein